MTTVINVWLWKAERRERKRWIRSKGSGTFSVRKENLNQKLQKELEMQVSYVGREIYLTPWSRVFHEKLTGPQLVKKFSALYEALRFITAFTSARHLSLSCARSVQSLLLHSISWKSMLIFSSYLSVPNGHFSSDHPIKILYALLLSPICATSPSWI